MLIKFNDKTLFTCEGVKLLPGVNEVDEGRYKTLQSNRIFQALVDEGKITVYPEDLNANQVKKLIPETYNKESLEVLAKKSKGPEIKKAIAKQLEKLGD